ncbi:Hsp70 family protein [Oceanirhabdus sp. W0125-5]|uniref:Hsp70 family protein n=1 Tax=Oceanirhabdus sp. W0125-5 TaxID=2999116 RepID=UPI0022F31709|nr:molecular chaperone HscC [Oceanirhabdus sp. W0125-5]WBW96333.1 molecular chaperone HscC [Oceanirhabdus sp. W0125-5]
MAIIGIDLGTTNSLVACFKDNDVVIIPNSLGERLTPSVVSVLDSGEIIIGQAAKERQVVKPKYTASAFKRFMGTNKVYRLGRHTLTPVDLSALIIKSLVKDAEEFLNEKVEEAIISVPAYFNDQQRKATKEAAMLAGIKVERLINEPTAAATAYHLHDSKNEKIVAIVDLGGGTFDVSILDIFDSILEVRAIAGDNYFGGEDFDAALVNHVCNSLKIDKASLTPKEYSRIKYLVEKCKIQLSTKKQTKLEVEVMGESHELIITSDDFQRVVSDLLKKIREPLKKAIKDANFNPDDIDEVILVGGSTRMHVVRSLVGKLFGFLPLCHLNPDEVVARGAAICAAMKARNEDLKDTVLTDVCPFTLGISVAKEISENEYSYDNFCPLIERNTMIPYSKSQIFSTVRDDQNSIQVEVFQGESRKASENLNLGKLNIKVPPKGKGEAAITVRFTYDINGILEVEIKSFDTGEVKKAILLNNNQLSDEEIEKRMLELEKIKIHPRKQDENMFLLSKGERLYETHLGDLREQIANELLLFESALDRQNPDEIKKAVKRIKEFYEFVEVNF